MPPSWQHPPLPPWTQQRNLFQGGGWIDLTVPGFSGDKPSESPPGRDIRGREFEGVLPPKQPGLTRALDPLVAGSIPARPTNPHMDIELLI